MPSQLLHSLFGEDLYLKKCELFEDLINKHREVFTLGCQGPDIFYHSQGRKPVGLYYGTLLHRRAYGDFSTLLLKHSLGNDQLTAYSLGFLTHAILDRHCHPYIVYKSLSPSRHYHGFFERIIDVLMFKQLRNSDIIEWDQENLLAKTCENPPDGLKELLFEVLKLTFPLKISKDEKLKHRIDNAFMDSSGFFRTSSPGFTSLKNPVYSERSKNIRLRHVNYIYPEELPDDIDFLNLNKKPWFDPSGGKTEDRRSFAEIYSSALDYAKQYFFPFLYKLNSKKNFSLDEISRIIGNGGLSIVDGNGFPCSPVCSDPLPLGEVLENQAYLRGIDLKL